jgi:hypothetical protein
MTELFNSLVAYLHDVFVVKFDGWVVLGFGFSRSAAARCC